MPRHWTSTYDFALDLFHTAHEQRERFLSETEYGLFCQFANDAILTCCDGCPDPVFLFMVATPVQIARSFLLAWRWHQADLGNEPDAYDHLESDL